jgi:uncharacterized protein
VSNVVNYFEIGTPDANATTAFYGNLFDWQIGEPSPTAYRMVDADKGGVWETSGAGGESWAIFYVQVDDVRATIDKAESLGGKVLVPLTDNGPLEFAHLQDPKGNRFGVWRPKG